MSNYFVRRPPILGQSCRHLRTKLTEEHTSNCGTTSFPRRQCKHDCMKFCFPAKHGMAAPKTSQFTQIHKSCFPGKLASGHPRNCLFSLDYENFVSLGNSASQHPKQRSLPKLTKFVSLGNVHSWKRIFSPSGAPRRHRLERLENRFASSGHRLPPGRSPAPSGSSFPHTPRSENRGHVLAPEGGEQRPISSTRTSFRGNGRV